MVRANDTDVVQSMSVLLELTLPLRWVYNKLPLNVAVQAFCPDHSLQCVREIGISIPLHILAPRQAICVEY